MKNASFIWAIGLLIIRIPASGQSCPEGQTNQQFANPNQSPKQPACKKGPSRAAKKPLDVGSRPASNPALSNLDTKARSLTAADSQASLNALYDNSAKHREFSPSITPVAAGTPKGVQTRSSDTEPLFSRPLTRIRLVPPPEPRGAEAKELPVPDAAWKLIDTFGSLKAAQKVEAVRNHKGNWLELQNLVGGLKNPEVDRSVDSRLRDINHYLGLYRTTHDWLIQTHNDDGALKRRGKVVARVPVLVVAAVAEVGYTGLKWVVQHTTQPSDDGEFKKMFNGSNTSKASWSEIWYGIRGATAGTIHLGPTE